MALTYPLNNMIPRGDWANRVDVAWLESQSYWMSQKLCFILYPGKRNYVASSGNAPGERGSAINHFFKVNINCNNRTSGTPNPYKN